MLIGDRDADALVALRFDAEARTLEHVASVPTGGRHPRDLHLTHDERFALVADQGSDSIAVVALDGRRADGGRVDARHAGAGLPGADALNAVLGRGCGQL